MTNSASTMAGETNLHPLVQPYVRLTQRNVQLFMHFASSPEMVSLWMKNGQSVFNQALQSAATGKTDDGSGKIAAQAQSNLTELGKSQAFAGLLQGMMQSQMQFLVDMAQTAMTTLSQGPAKMMEQMQHAGGSAMSIPLEDVKPARAASKRKDH